MSRAGVKQGCRDRCDDLGTKRPHSCAHCGATVVSMTAKAIKAAGPAKVATPWGRATVIEELRVPQRVGDRRFDSIVQLLEDAKGGELIRFAYSTGGTIRRGPVTLRGRDLERLRADLASRPRLAEALGLTESSPPPHN
jgi:hypothetical protein